MNGNRGLLDSNVIIDASKGIVSVQDIVANYDDLFTSIICYVETLGYKFADETEKKIVKQILENIEIIELNRDIADIAIEYRKNNKIKLPDALVLASAKYLNADLLTSNVSDFQKIDNSVNLVVPRST